MIKNKDNQELPEGEVGELMICGPSVAQGYYKNIQATEEIFQQKSISLRSKMVKQASDCNGNLLKRFLVQFYIKENKFWLLNNETGL